MTRWALVVAGVVTALIASCGSRADVVMSTSAREGALPDSPAEVEACVRRFDDNPPYDGSRGTGGGNPIWQRWLAADVDAMQAAVARVLPGQYAIARGVTDGAIRPGWVVNGKDPVRMRFVALVDPEAADIAALSREMAAAVDAEHRRNPRTEPLDAVVLPSCFRQSDLAATDRDVHAELYPDPPAADAPCRAQIPMSLDSRVHVALTPSDRQYGQRLVKQYGPMLGVSYDLTCSES